MPLHALDPFLLGADLRSLARAVFRSLAVARFATVPDLLALHGPDGLTREHLAVWAAAGLFHRGNVPPDPISGPEVEYVALTTVGARVLLASADGHVEGVSSARLRRSSQKRRHDLAVGSFALAVRALASRRKVDLLGLETDPTRFSASGLLAEPGALPDRVPLQADAYVLTRSTGGQRALLVEVDRGTVSLRTMGRKYAGYLAWKAANGPERDFAVRALRVLTVAPDERRAKRLHEAALAANDGKGTGFLLFMTDTQVRVEEPERLLLPVARPLDGASDKHAFVF
jgi:hypothetical protein